MGDSGSALARETRNLVGKQRWEAHCNTVEGFWENIASYLEPYDPCLLKLYQDGMPVGDALGGRIAEKAAARGSRNYQLLLKLIDKGAELRKTEDAALLVQEHENIRRGLENPQSSPQTRSCRAEQERLTEARDRTIAHAVNSTLREGEIGVLFVGAAHDVCRHLDRDIQVEEVKRRDSLRAYLAALISGDPYDLRMLSDDLAPKGAPGQE